MKTIKTNGIIIAENNLNDFDKMLTILTPNMGKIGCIAKGARKNKSLLMAGTQFLCYGEYLLYKSGEIYSMNSCELIEIFYNIRTDFDKLKYASYITKIVSDVTTENQNTYRILRLFLNTLYIISEKESDYNFISEVFKMRLVAMLGFMPNVKECTNCKKNENIKYFSIKDSGFKCEICGSQDKSSIEISPTTKDAIKYVLLVPTEKLYSFDLPEEFKKEFEIVSKIYFETKMEKDYKI